MKEPKSLGINFTTNYQGIQLETSLSLDPSLNSIHTIQYSIPLQFTETLEMSFTSVYDIRILISSLFFSSSFIDK